MIIALSAFVFTNIDDLLLLVGFYASGAYRGSRIVLGQYVGMAVIMLVSGVCIALSFTFAPAYVGLLGLVPIGMGIVKFWQGSADSAEKTDVLKTGGALTVAGVVISNGGDNVAVYTTLFAASSVEELSIATLVFIFMTGLWCALAYWLVRQEKLGGILRNWGHRLLPYIFIALGVYIMVKDGTLGLL